ncbi:MAG: FAD-dependent oxidoreductase, partial [Actinomycetota bacterium]|nr:FAD-dependent oxidoreductase [Actinomycetota bacterium]
MAGTKRDVVIIGAGPAGIFAALEFVRAGVTDVLIAEKGRGIEKRECPAHQTACVGCRTCDIMTGWGGAGAFSDGKLTLTPDVGGWLAEYVGREELISLIDYADSLWLEFGADTHVHGPDQATAERLEREAVLANMRLVPMRIRHLGTDRSPEVLQAMRAHLEAAGVEIRTECAVSRIIAEDTHVTGVELADGTVIEAGAVIAAPGREGSDWLAGQAAALKLKLNNNAVDIGVRVECPAPVMEPLTDPLYEAKLIYHSRA